MPSVQCHHQGGIGGGGDLQQNIDILSVNASTKNQKKRLLKVHPGFEGRNGQLRNSIVLHRFALDQAYTLIRARMLVFDGAVAATDKDLQRLQRAIAVQPLQVVSLNPKINGIRSQRNPSALFGDGLIDQVTNRQLQNETFPIKSPGVSGRVSVMATQPRAKLGRFGWRGQTTSLREFVIDACATELGLGSRTRSQSPDPRNPEYKAPGVDLTDQEINALVQFVVDLRRPEQILPNDPVALQRVNRGQQVFAEVACTDCHVQTRAGIKDIYSDLLLHDMGPGLADPVLAPQFDITKEAPPKDEQVVNTVNGVDVRKVQRKINEQMSFRREPIEESGGSYDGGGGGFVPTNEPPPINPSQEWRTPPLWGVEASSPYMHDGRARTLVEAIALHGGEAQDSTNAFLSLPMQDQMKLIEFLKTLRAPQ